MRPAVVLVVSTACVATAGLRSAEPARAHSEGLTPYRYVSAPPGVRSEGPPERSVSNQPLGQAAFAGTTDNQMQLTLPAGALPSQKGETGVRVTLDQLDPADLPALPAGLEPEGNGYRVSLTYARSRKPLVRLREPATLGLSAPAPPTALYQLIDGAWQKARSTPVTAEEGFTSVVELERPGTFLQAYDPTSAPRIAASGAVGDPSAPSSDNSAPRAAALLTGAVLLVAAMLVGLWLGRIRARQAPRPFGRPPS